jgi:hypothetical protein
MRRLVRGVSIGIGLALLAGGLALAQEQSTRTEIRNGKVVYVAPGTIAIRGKNGVRIFTKADWKDIKVERDGQVIEPDQLHKGDVVTATVITAGEPPAPTGIAEEAGTGEMTSERVIWTEIKRGKVRGVGPTDLLIKTDTGLKHFTKDEWKDTKIWKDGQMINPEQLHVGDVVTATFITKAMPTVSEEQAVKYETKPAPRLPSPRRSPPSLPWSTRSSRRRRAPFRRSGSPVSRAWDWVSLSPWLVACGAPSPRLEARHTPAAGISRPPVSFSGARGFPATGAWPPRPCRPSRP